MGKYTYYTTAECSAKKYIGWKCSKCKKINIRSFDLCASSTSISLNRPSDMSNISAQIWSQQKLLSLLEKEKRSERENGCYNFKYYKYCGCRYCMNQEVWARQKDKTNLHLFIVVALLLFAVAFVCLLCSDVVVSLVGFAAALGMLLGVFVLKRNMEKNKAIILRKLNESTLKEKPVHAYSIKEIASMLLQIFPEDMDEILRECSTYGAIKK